MDIKNITPSGVFIVIILLVIALLALRYLSNPLVPDSVVIPAPSASVFEATESAIATPSADIK